MYRVHCMFALSPLGCHSCSCWYGFSCENWSRHLIAKFTCRSLFQLRLPTVLLGQLIITCVLLVINKTLNLPPSFRLNVWKFGWWIYACAISLSCFLVLKAFLWLHPLLLCSFWQAIDLRFARQILEEYLWLEKRQTNH